MMNHTDFSHLKQAIESKFPVIELFHSLLCFLKKSLRNIRPLKEKIRLMNSHYKIIKTQLK